MAGMLTEGRPQDFPARVKAILEGEVPVDTNHEWHLLLFMSLLLPEPSLKLVGL
ncbi:hypothetical protein NC651_028395 [Populus alba x Populus x berolinensis]|nr:hypothetical protein NC651_028395 [Populus alba x Populus x berolinensis]